VSEHRRCIALEVSVGCIAMIAPHVNIASVEACMVTGVKALSSTALKNCSLRLKLFLYQLYFAVTCGLRHATVIKV
jgi:hypothetical protein